jgi:hypothetical protein
VRIADLNWMQVEEYLRHDDRIVLPLGSTEQHAYLSLATDSILAEAVAVEAAEPTGVPPVLAYSLTPLKDGKSQSGSQSRGWPEAQTPGWPGRRRVPCISLRCTDTRRDEARVPPP